MLQQGPAINVNRDKSGDANVFIFLKNDRFVMKTIVFSKSSFFKKGCFEKRSLLKTIVFQDDPLLTIINEEWKLT